MRRKLLTLAIITAYLMTTVVTPVFAAGESAVDTVVEIEGNVDTTESIGAEAKAQTDNASMSVDGNISVNYDGTATSPDISCGLYSEASGSGKTSIAIGESINVMTTETTQTFGAQAAASNGGVAVVYAGDIDVTTHSTDQNSITAGLGVATGTAGGSSIASAIVERNINVQADDGTAFGALLNSQNGIMSNQIPVTATVIGDITVRSGKDAYGSQVYATNGVAGIGTTGSKIDVQAVDEATGTATIVDGGGIASAIHMGNITAKSTGQAGNAVGVCSTVQNGTGSSLTSVIGNVVAEGYRTIGVYTVAAGGGENDVQAEVLGNVIAKGNACLGIKTQGSASATAGSQLITGVFGDLISDGVGIDATGSGGVDTDILVLGSINAANDAIVIDNGATDLSITAWKIDTTGKEHVVKEFTGSSLAFTERARQAEEDIHYIIKIDPSQKGNISTTYGTADYTYKDTAGQDTIYKTATEGTRVGIRLNVPDGYELKGVYSDAGRQTALAKDADGNYYLIVPRGGGITVNMWLVPIEEGKDDDHESTNGGELIPGAAQILVDPFIVSGGMAVATMNDTDTIVLTPANLASYAAAGLTSFVINTQAGTFVIPIDEQILTLISSGQPIRFVLVGNMLLVYSGDSTVPVKAVSL